MLMNSRPWARGIPLDAPADTAHLLPEQESDILFAEDSDPAEPPSAATHPVHTAAPVQPQPQTAGHPPSHHLATPKPQRTTASPGGEADRPAAHNAVPATPLADTTSAAVITPTVQTTDPASQPPIPMPRPYLQQSSTQSPPPAPAVTAQPTPPPPASNSWNRDFGGTPASAHVA